VLDRLVTKITLDGARIDAVIRQFIAAAMSQHMRVDFRVIRVKAGRSGRAFHHGLETTL
jgi:osmotically-inducible protein OsmY